MKMMDRAPYTALMRRGEYTLSFRGDSERYDWDDAYYMYFHSSELEKNNWSRYSKGDLDQLLQKGRAILSRDERIAIYRRVVEILMDDVPILYVSKPIVGVEIGRAHV